jgi:hypothetical protein
MKPKKILKRTPSNIKINAFSIRVTPLWFANTNIQFIIDPYAITSYCRSYITKIDKLCNLIIVFNNTKMHLKQN